MVVGGAAVGAGAEVGEEGPEEEDEKGVVEDAWSWLSARLGLSVMMDRVLTLG